MVLKAQAFATRKGVTVLALFVDEIEIDNDGRIIGAKVCERADYRVEMNEQGKPVLLQKGKL